MFDVVAGPSHVVRWREHVEAGVVPGANVVKYVGLGGAPSWSKKVFNVAADTAGESGRVLLVVPDFRFGNAIALELEGPTSKMRDGYLGVDRAALNAEHDEEMYQRWLDGLKHWNSTLKGRVSFMLWDALGRQVLHRLEGRHISDGLYAHPFFDSAKIREALPELDFVDLNPLLRLPMHEVNRLYIDESLHPSQIGYLMLNSIVHGADVKEAYSTAVSQIENILLGWAAKISTVAGRPVVLTGQSVWLDVLSQTLGAGFGGRLAEAGLVISPLKQAPGRQSVKDLLNKSGEKPDNCQIVLFSAGGADVRSWAAEFLELPDEMLADVPLLDWEISTRSIIESRTEKPNWRYVDESEERRGVVLNFDLADGDVEAGPLGQPTWGGIEKVLAWLLNDLNVSTQNQRKGKGSILSLSGTYSSYRRSKYRSIKHSTYFPVYDSLLADFAGENITLVEVGVLSGGSLLMWRDLLGPNAKIIGIDLNPEAVWLRDRGFEIVVGDQSDPEFWTQFYNDHGPIDVLIDDGGHKYDDQIVTVSSTLDHVRDGGLVVVEDTHTSYMDEFGYGSRRTFIDWCFAEVNGINHRFSGLRSHKVPEYRFWSVQFFESMVVFQVDRAKSRLPSLPTQNEGIDVGIKDVRVGHEQSEKFGIDDYFWAASN